MHSAPIFFLCIGYSVKKYVSKNKKIVLETGTSFKTSNVVCIGNTVEVLNDEYWNSNLLSKLHEDNKSKHGCVIKVTMIHEELSVNGCTTQRFEREFPA